MMFIHNFKITIILSLSIVAAFAIWILVVEHNEQLTTTKVRIETQTHATTLSNSIELALERRFAVFSGFKSFVDNNLKYVGTHVDEQMKARLTAFIGRQYEEITGFRNFSLAPQGKQAWVYPIIGNEKVLGHDLLNDVRPRVRADVQRAIKSRKPTLSGPYVLRQGGLGLIVRQAVFVGDTFWGVVAMVIDMQTILLSSGVEGDRLDKIAGLRTSGGKMFWGEERAFSGQHKISSITLPEGSWEFANIPKSGIPTIVAAETLAFKISFGAFLLMVVAFVYIFMRRQVVLEKEVGLKTTELQSIYNTLVDYKDQLEEKIIERTQHLEQQITERTYAEAAMRESEERLLQILDNSPFGVSIVSIVNKKRLYVNRRFTEMVGGGLNDRLRAAPIADSYLDPEKLEENWTVFNRDGVIAGTEEERKRQDGKEWWCLADWRPISFSGEKAVMVWHSDISERKRTEEELRHKSELVDLLRTTATNANKSVNFDEALQSCLTTITEFTGWPVGHIYVMSEDEDNVLVSSGIWHLDDPERFAVFRKITEKTKMYPGQAFVTRVVTAGEPLWIEDVTQQSTFSRLGETGQDIQVRAGFALPVSSQENVVAVLEFYTDVAVVQNDELLQSLVHIGTQLSRVFERKQAEIGLRNAMEEIDIANRSLEQKVEVRTRELHEAIEKAEAANLTKSEFLANMSHELRTPLNAIIGFSEMIKEAMLGPLEGRYKDYARDINASGEHLLGIIADILDLSKVEAGELDIEKEEVDLAEITAACKTMVSGRAEEAGVNLTFDVSRDLPLLYADPLRLKQVLLNLTGNAIKFTPGGGRITIIGEAIGDGGVALMVSDTGIGIADEDIPRVLERFGQVRDGHMQAYEGAGLGLAMTKSLMELHGGTIEIKSTVGKGTTVTVIFPPEQTKILRKNER